MKVVAMIVVTGFATGGQVRAEDFRFESMGVRSAFSATRINQHFYQVEAFTRFAAPGSLDLGRDWHLRAVFDASAGMLARFRESDKGAIATIGPILALKRESFPMTFLAGSSGTLLSRDDFNGVNFGIPFQFTTHLGVDWRIGQSWAIAYRYQHMSNATISPHNPGLDMHSFGIRLRF